MKTKIVIEIESPDKLDIYPEEGQTAEDWKGKEEELNKERVKFAEDLHDKVVKQAKDYFKEDFFEEETIDALEESSVEDWETFEDYGIKVNVESSKSEESNKEEQ